MTILEIDIYSVLMDDPESPNNFPVTAWMALFWSSLREKNGIEQQRSKLKLNTKWRGKRKQPSTSTPHPPPFQPSKLQSLKSNHNQSREYGFMRYL